MTIADINIQASKRAENLKLHMLGKPALCAQKDAPLSTLELESAREQ
jgi:hypothetical protein